MVTNKTDVEKTGEIVNLLPRKNCGKCGFKNCMDTTTVMAGV
jgi:CO dehydrogenase/acetyl-CoA synthase gamma subunit (corrinoid Fe-S protein)